MQANTKRFVNTPVVNYFPTPALPHSYLPMIFFFLHLIPIYNANFITVIPSPALTLQERGSDTNTAPGCPLNMTLSSHIRHLASFIRTSLPSCPFTRLLLLYVKTTINYTLQQPEVCAHLTITPMCACLTEKPIPDLVPSFAVIITSTLLGRRALRWILERVCGDFLLVQHQGR